MTTWREGVRDIVGRMPSETFTLTDVYDASGALRASWPENRAARDTIRKVLQELRDLGEIEFLDGKGSYRQLRPKDTQESGTDPVIRKRQWSAPNYHNVSRPPPSDPFASAEVTRFEFQLQAEYGDWLRGKGFEVERWSFQSGEVEVEPDLVNVTTGEIIEAKRNGSRSLVRTAIGQVLDYALLSRTAGEGLRPALLFPARLTPYLESLCESVEVRVWWRDGAAFHHS